MDATLIQDLTESIETVERTARAEFGSLTGDELNWRPGEGRWSIGECLNHLMTANEPYFPIFESVANGTKTTTILERLPVLPSLFGSLVLNVVKPETKRKSRAPKVFAPSPEPVDTDIVDRFCEQQRKLLAAIQPLANVDLDNVIVTSPVASFITYSLRDALLIVVRHEERHLIQAQNVLRAMGEG